MSDYEEDVLGEEENMFGMSIKSDDVDPLVEDEDVPLVDEEDLLEEEKVGPFLEDGDEEEIY